tara:strand:+ start:64 stop:708 length:645 start_codon:yes stop_codon:yes gene_type:complete
MARALTNLSVSKIKSRLLNVSQSSQYVLTLSVPAAVRSKVADLNDLDFENISLSCSDANLPGSSLATVDVTNDYQGVTEKMAYRRIYDDVLGLTFYVDRNYNVIKLFERWIDYISGITDTEKYKSPFTNQRVRYPKTYKNDIFVTKFERDHHSNQSSLKKNVLDYTFVQAFPRDITAIPVSYESSSVLKCNVSFSFIRYVVEQKEIQSNDLVPF